MDSEFSVSHGVFEDETFKKLKPSSKYLYCHLTKLQDKLKDKKGWFWHKMTQLVDETGINIKTLKCAKRELIENYFIEVKHDKRTGFNQLTRTNVDHYRILEYPQKRPEKPEILLQEPLHITIHLHIVPDPNQ